MKINNTPFKIIIFLFFAVIFYFMAPYFKKKVELKRIITFPKEIQYFCNLSKVDSKYSTEVIAINWRKGNLAIYSEKNELPILKQNILDEIPLVESNFSFENNTVKFKTDNDSEEWFTLPGLNYDSMLSPTLDWHKKIFTQVDCPWFETPFVKDLKKLFFKKQTSILCYKDPKTSASSIFVINPREKIFWIWAAPSLKSWNILNQDFINSGQFSITENTISLNLNEKPKMVFKINKQIENQILEMTYDKFIFNQDSCTWLSQAKKLDLIKGFRENYFCLKPLKLEKPKKKNNELSQSGSSQYSDNEHPYVSSVVILDLNKKTFSLFGNFLGDINELLEKPTNQGTIEIAGVNISFLTEDGKILFSGALIQKNLKIREMVFNNTFCPF